MGILPPAKTTPCQLTGPRSASDPGRQMWTFTIGPEGGPLLFPSSNTDAV